MTTTAERLKKDREKNTLVSTPTPGDFFKKDVNIEEIEEKSENEDTIVTKDTENTKITNDTKDDIETTDILINSNVKQERLNSTLKVTEFFKILDEVDDRQNLDRLQALIPIDMLRSLSRMVFKLKDIAKLKGKSTRNVGINTLMKMILTDSISRIEKQIDKERDQLIAGEK